VGWDRGFTGYVADNETGVDYAINRYYSPTLGRWLSRDRAQKARRRASALDGYQDGTSLYGAYFIPNAVDPFGLECPCKEGQTGPVKGGHCCNGTLIPAKSILVCYNGKPTKLSDVPPDPSEPPKYPDEPEPDPTDPTKPKYPTGWPVDIPVYPGVWVGGGSSNPFHDPPHKVSDKPHMELPSGGYVIGVHFEW